MFLFPLSRAHTTSRMSLSCHRYHTHPTLSRTRSPDTNSAHLNFTSSLLRFTLGRANHRPDCLVCPGLPVGERAIQGLGLIIPTTLIPIRGSTRGVELNLTESGPRPATGPLGHQQRETEQDQTTHPSIPSIQSAFALGDPGCLPLLRFPPPCVARLLHMSTCPSFASVVWTLAFA